jgi:hypothetical protein
MAGGSLGTASILIKVDTDARAAAGEIRRTGTSIGGLGSSWKKAALASGIAAAGAVAVQFGTDIVDAASRSEQSVGAVESVFGRTASAVERHAARAAEAVGLSATEYRELATVLGAQMDAKGLDGLAAKSDDLIGIGADLAATFGGSTAEAVAALGAGLRGEFDTMEKYGLSLSAAAVKSEAVRLGLTDATGAMDDQAKAAATLSLIHKQTAKQQGQYAREQDTLAGSTAELSAKWDDFQVVLGEKVLPIAAKFLTWVLNDLIPGIEKAVKWVGNLVSTIVGLPGAFMDIVTDLRDSALAAGEAIVEGILDGLGAAGGAVTTFAGDVWQAFKDLINDFMISPIKNFRFTIDPPGPLGPWNFQPFGSLPYLAAGGIVRGPTLAMIGEAGPEAVVPLDRMGGPGIVVNVTAGVGDPVEIGRRVVDTIRQYERAAGAGWRA